MKYNAYFFGQKLPNVHAWFIDQLLPLIEKLVPVRGLKKKGRNRIDKRRNLLWRYLGKIQGRIQSSSEVDIEMACQELNPSSAPGADRQPASILKMCR